MLSRSHLELWSYQQQPLISSNSVERLAEAAGSRLRKLSLDSFLFQGEIDIIYDIYMQCRI